MDSLKIAAIFETKNAQLCSQSVFFHSSHLGYDSLLLPHNAAW